MATASASSASQSLCRKCAKPATSKTVLHSCMSCDKAYHSRCNEFLTGSDDKGNVLRFCTVCAGTFPNLSSSYPGRTRSTANTGDNQQQTPEVNPNLLLALDERLSLGFNEGRKALLEFQHTIDLNLKEALAKISRELVVLEQIPALIHQVKAIGEGLDTLRNDQAALRKDCMTLQLEQTKLRQEVENRGNEQSVTAAACSKLNELEAAVKNKINNKLAQLTTREHALTTDLVLGGFRYAESLNLHQLALALLRLLKPTLSAQDILAVRPLGRPTAPDKAHVIAPSPPSSSGDEPLADVSLPNHAPLLVSLSSPLLLKAIIAEKIRIRKVHTSAVESSLLGPLAASKYVSPSLINVNEYLPRETYSMLRTIRGKARELNNAFLVMVRGGIIHVRRTKEDTPVRILTSEDFADFLGKLEHLP